MESIYRACTSCQSVCKHKRYMYFKVPSFLKTLPPCVATVLKLYTRLSILEPPSNPTWLYLQVSSDDSSVPCLLWGTPCRGLGQTGVQVVTVVLPTMYLICWQYSFKSYIVWNTKRKIIFNRIETWRHEFVKREVANTFMRSAYLSCDGYFLLHYSLWLPVNVGQNVLLSEWSCMQLCFKFWGYLYAATALRRKIEGQWGLGFLVKLRIRVRVMYGQWSIRIRIIKG